MPGGSVVVSEDQGGISGAADGDLLLSERDGGPGQIAGGDHERPRRAAAVPGRPGGPWRGGRLDPARLLLRCLALAAGRGGVIEQVGPHYSDSGDDE